MIVINPKLQISPEEWQTLRDAKQILQQIGSLTHPAFDEVSSRADNVYNELENFFEYFESEREQFESEWR